MLEVILTILKVLGIIILSLLGIIIALLLLVLFVPIRYNIKGEVEGDYNVKAKLSWLLHIVTVNIGFDNENGLTNSIRVFGLKIYPRKKKKTKVKKAKKTKQTKQTNAYDELEDNSQNVHLEAEKEADNVDITDIKPVIEAKEETKAKAKTKPKKEKKKKKSIKDKFNDIKAKFTAIKNKLKKLMSDANYWITFINDEQTKSALGFLFSQIKDLLKKIIPKTHSVYVKFGSGDPCSTGQIAGYAAVAKTMLGLNIDFIPDFENKVIESKFKSKGYLRVISLLIIAIKIYKNKDFRKVLNTLIK